MEAQKIIITGGATRIGAAIAERLSGFKVQILIQYNKSKSKAENLKNNLEQKGSKIYLIKADLGKEKDVLKIVKFAKKIWVILIVLLIMPLYSKMIKLKILIQKVGIII